MATPFHCSKRADVARGLSRVGVEAELGRGPLLQPHLVGPIARSDARGLAPAVGFEFHPAMLKVFEVEPTQEQRGSVIWMHGLGATNHDFDDIVPELQAPYLRFVFPAAPVRPVTINGGMRMPAWYDILTFDDPPLRESEPDVREAAAAIAELVQREVDRGVPRHSIVLAGFSQGAAMALHVGLREPEALAGVLALSGYLVLPHALASERSVASASTPLFVAHGTQDPIVPLMLSRRAVEQLRELGYTVQHREYPMGHSLCLPEVHHIREWIQELFT